MTHRGGDAGGLYGELDLALSWSERELPERERTKHVHRLHPYLGKFVPQLVEALLQRYVRLGGRVLDPRRLRDDVVQALESGYDAVGVDIAAFNALLISVKTREHDLELLAADVGELPQAASANPASGQRLRRRVVRAAGRRRAASLPLADPGVRELRRPSRRPRPCRPLGAADDALRPRLPARRSRASTGATSTVARAARSRAPASSSRHHRHGGADHRVRVGARRGDARRSSSTATRVSWARRPHDGVIVAALPGPDRLPRAAPVRLRAARARRPPRAGARRGSARHGQGRDRGVRRGIAAVLARSKAAVRRGAPVCIVVNDRRGLYPEILERAGLRLDERLERRQPADGPRGGVLRVDPDPR